VYFEPFGRKQTISGLHFRSLTNYRATQVCDRTPIERPTAPTQVTVGTNTSVDTEIDSRHTTSYSTSIDTHYDCILNRLAENKLLPVYNNRN